MVKNMLASAGDTRDADLISQLGTAQEEEMATHSSILAWKIPWTEEPGRLQVHWVTKSRVTEYTHATPSKLQNKWPGVDKQKTNAFYHKVDQILKITMETKNTERYGLSEIIAKKTMTK